MPDIHIPAETVEQFAMFMQRRDAIEQGGIIDGVARPTWDELGEGVMSLTGKVATEAERALATRLLDDGCPIAEVARTFGVRSRVITRWFPDAPRCTPTQKGEHAQLHKFEVEVLGRARGRRFRTDDPAPPSERTVAQP